jgi:hypothetical protein
VAAPSTPRPAAEPPPWAGLDRLPDRDLTGVRGLLLDDIFVRRDAAASAAAAAVVRIGRRGVWRIGMRACVNAPVFRVRGWQERANELRALGLVAAETTEAVDGRVDAYLPALLQGVGRLLVYRAAAPRPPRVAPDRALVERTARSLQAPLGALIAEVWQLGPAVATGAGFFPDPAQAPAGHRRVAEVTRIAVVPACEARASAAGGTYGGPALLRAWGVSEARVPAILRAAAAAWARVPRSPHPSTLG